MVARIQNGLSNLQATAQSRGGVCLSNEYRGVDYKYRFRCAAGHEWESTYYSVVTLKRWCAYCAPSGRRVDPLAQLERACATATSKGGACLSDEYISSTQMMRWRCVEGHEWNGSFSNIVSRGKWCPWCAGNKVDSSAQLEKAIAYAQARGGKCLSVSYAGNKLPMDWECEAGHKWQAAYGTVVNRGAWCAICGGSYRIPEEQLQKAKEVANSKGGECLTETYISNSDPMQWQCGRGHKWQAPFYSVVQAGSWCQICSSGLKERIARDALEQLFGVPFPKYRPQWLRNPKTGRPLEIDGCNTELGLAFEYHGPQHYKVVLPFKMNSARLESSKYRDKLKKSLCKAHGIEIVEIPFTVESDGMLEWISNRINKVPAFAPFRPALDDWRTLKPLVWTESTSYSIDSLREHARRRNGECLTEAYLGTTAKHRWKCEKGHEWDATWDSINNVDTWCPVCCGNVILNPLGQLQEIAHSKGGQCLSTEYLGGQVKLRWRCKDGHEWEAKPSHIRLSGSWCPICSGRLVNPIEQLKLISNIAASKGGECLADKYVNSTSKMPFRCAEGHEWHAVPSSIKSGRWCPECAKRIRLETRKRRSLAG